MQKNRQFNSLVKFLLAVITFIFILSTVAQAKSLKGILLDGQAYSGKYSFVEINNIEEGPGQFLTVELKIDGKKDRLQYTYLADDYPFVELSNMGFLSIIVNCRGMEGHITYNYILPIRGALVSIGSVQMDLHLGRVMGIDIQPNKNLTQDEINKYASEILKFDYQETINSSNAFSSAGLLLLGQGKFLTSIDKHKLTALYRGNDISDDPVLLHAIKKIIGFDSLAPKNNLAFTEKTIVSNKAYFSDFPTSPSKRTPYLVKGDVVSLITQSADNEYWLVSYVSPRGRKTENWLRCEDIDYCLSSESDDYNK